MNILHWISTNHTLAFMLIVIAIAILVYAFANKKGLLCKAALYAVSVAEEEWGSGMSKVKFAKAYTYMKTQYPLLTLFLTEEKLTQIIEDALVELKEILATKAAKQQVPIE